jgi:hypothetical protein
MRKLKKGRQKWLVLASVALILLLIILGLVFRSRVWASTERAAALVFYASLFDPALTHEQEVWLHALEWCESRGVKTAINPKDLDGTPSYYSFQFKPSTFKLYGVKYGIFSRLISDERITEMLSDYRLQKRIVSLMMQDEKVNWRREFPDCVRKLGFPPKDK